MSDTITFYHNPMSRAQMVHWMLEEVDADYRTVILDFEKGDHKKRDFLAINPMGKVPTIVHQDTVVTETGAIIAYLADAFPDHGLAPPSGNPQRGPYYRWLFFGAGCIEPAVLDKMLDRPLPEREGVLGYGSYRAVLGALQQALDSHDYLAGDRFSAADVYVASQLSWARHFGAPGIKENSVLNAYVDRCIARSAYQRSVGAEQARLAAQRESGDEG